MEEMKDSARPAADSGWKDPSFDATTNFSLLGWLLGMWFQRPKTEQQIDFTLDE